MPAIIGKPAPSWKGQAIVNGQIEEISLDSFKGWLASKAATITHTPHQL
jgi:hypothetical protein